MPAWNRSTEYLTKCNRVLCFCHSDEQCFDEIVNDLWQTLVKRGTFLNVRGVYL